MGSLRRGDQRSGAEGSSLAWHFRYTLSSGSCLRQSRCCFSRGKSPNQFPSTFLGGQRESEPKQHRRIILDDHQSQS
ncbi:hypothetical protein F2Q69_00028201 [Brassica cretica]|uniref:Uncharacterized protein n=1 Tax=Brassica cretica TaxID=69181 RepID=A0A8S9SAQ4_BRACR|nr:hypothetical protein F2Q69_00028201 [Brassica cretica]